jgi:hypothetical protein
MRKIVVTLVMLFVGGCGEKMPSNANVPLEKVPERVMKVAMEKLPGVKFEQAWKTPNGPAGRVQRTARGPRRYDRLGR